MWTGARPTGCGGWAPGGGPVTVTVYARGFLAAPVVVNIASDGGGTLSKSSLLIPAGANGQDSYTFTPVPGRVTTLSYSGGIAGQVPPPRRVYSIADPVAHAASSLAEAAMAILARYSASKWEMADGYTDFLQGRPAGNGEVLRAVADSGFGSSVGNAMEMLNWMNQDRAGMGPLTPPVLRVENGRRYADLGAGSSGLWCRKTIAGPTQPNPRNRMPYHLQDPHFMVMALRLPAAGSGVALQASAPHNGWHAELAFSAGRPQARRRDPDGQELVLSAPGALQAGVAASISLRGAQGAQGLRVNSANVAGGSNSFAGAPFGQLLIGWGYQNDQPVPGFGGHAFGAISGRGNPSDAEMGVLERYLLTLANG